MDGEKPLQLPWQLDALRALCGRHLGDKRGPWELELVESPGIQGALGPCPDWAGSLGQTSRKLTPFWALLKLHLESASPKEHFCFQQIFSLKVSNNPYVPGEEQGGKNRE